MEALLWTIIYLAIAFGGWLWMQLTTRDQRSDLLYGGAMLLFIPAGLYELVLFVRHLFS